MNNNLIKVKLYGNNNSLLNKFQEILESIDGIESKIVNYISNIEETNILMLLSDTEETYVLDRLKESDIYIVSLDDVAFYCYCNNNIIMSIKNSHDLKKKIKKVKTLMI